MTKKPPREPLIVQVPTLLMRTHAIEQATEINALKMDKSLYEEPPRRRKKKVDEEEEEELPVEGEVIDSFVGYHHFLSNFYSAPAFYEGKRYPTSEHAFQAAKTLKPELRAKIAKLGRPSDAKRFGKTVVIRPGWDRIKFDVMRAVLRSKFSNPTLRKLLLATGDAKLVEANTWGDRIWGVFQGRGENWLGKILMEIRAELKASET